MEYLADTPSGDPMHYAYEEAGAKWNAVTGFWEMNGLKDLTNANIRSAYNRCGKLAPALYRGSKARTNFPIHQTTFGDAMNINLNNVFWASDLEVIDVGQLNLNACAYTFVNCTNLRNIIGVINIANNKVTSLMFGYCGKLESVSVKGAGYNLEFNQSPLLTTASIKFLIENSDVNKFTVTLHPDAYARAMADPAVQSALAAKPNVSLASV